MGKRTPREIAQDRLDTATRRLERNKHYQAELGLLLAQAQGREIELAALVDHLKTHPALRPPEETS